MTDEVFSTSAPAVKAGLITEFAQLPELRDVQVAYGDPVGSETREYVFLGKIEWDPEDVQVTYPATDRASREEIYEIELYVGSAPIGADAQSAETRAFAVAAFIEKYLRRRTSFPWGRRTKLEFIYRKAHTFPLDDGQACVIRGGIRVSTRK